MSISLDELAMLEQLDREATPGPVTVSLDYFGEDHGHEVEVCITDEDVHLLAIIGTDVEIDSPGCWGKAKESQQYRDAVHLAAARNALPKLLATHREQQKRLATLEADRDMLLAACKAAEWVNCEVYEDTCPVCRIDKSRGHNDDCILKTAISDR